MSNGDKDAKRGPMRLPGFVLDEEIGLGDAMRRVAYVAGINPCDGCKRRAIALNRLMVFGPRRNKNS